MGKWGVRVSAPDHVGFTVITVDSVVASYPQTGVTD